MMIILPDDIGTTKTAHANKRKARMKQIPTSIIGESSTFELPSSCQNTDKNRKTLKKRRDDNCYKEKS